MILLAVALVAMLVAGNASATLMMDVVASSVSTGGTISTDGKSVVFDNPTDAAAGVVTLKLYAYMTTGAPGATNDSIKQVQGGMTSVRDAANYSVKGNLSAVTFGDNWAGKTGTLAGIPALNAMNDLVIPNTPSGSLISAANPAYVSVSASLDGYTNALYIGTFTYSVSGVGTALDTPTTINYLTTLSSALPAGSWYENSVNRTGLSNPKANASYLAGTTPVSIKCAVPEPTTFVLLGMGALALVFVRRRK